MFIAALTVGEMFSTGGITALIGMGMTFIVLALLIFFSWMPWKKVTN